MITELGKTIEGQGYFESFGPMVCIQKVRMCVPGYCTSVRIMAGHIGAQAGMR